MATQKGSIAWYNEMAGKLKVVALECKLERIRVNNKLPLFWSTEEIKNWIRKARNTISTRLKSFQEQYPLTMEDVWIKDTGKTQSLTKIEYTERDFRDAILAWSDRSGEAVPYKMVAGRYIFGIDPYEADGLIRTTLMTKEEILAKYPHLRDGFKSAGEMNQKRDEDTHRALFEKAALDGLNGVRGENPLKLMFKESETHQRTKELMAKSISVEPEFNPEGKMYYIKEWDLLVYCHDYTNKMLTCGDLCHHVSDARTSIMRQKISVKNFLNYNPIEIDIKFLHKYAFLKDGSPKGEKWDMWGTKSKLDYIKTYYFKEAQKLTPIWKQRDDRPGMMM